MNEFERAQQALTALSVLRNDAHHLYNTTHGDQHEDHLEDVEVLQKFIDSIISKHTPLTGGEMLEMKGNEIETTELRYGVYLTTVRSIKDFGFSVVYGVGHTKAEAERDAINQWKGARK